MELSRVEIFRAMNGSEVPNVKDFEGQYILPVAFHTHEYEGQDGNTHNVLVIKDGKTGGLCKTEVKAFINKFMAYDEAFGTLPDNEKPEMIIKPKTSKKGNKYIDFDVVEQ